MQNSTIDVAAIRKEFLALLTGDLNGIKVRNRFDEFLGAVSIAVQNEFLAPGCEERLALERRYMRIVERLRSGGRLADLHRFGEMLGLLALLSQADIAAGGTGDVLSAIMHQGGSTCDDLGQFFTPPDISMLCARLTLEEPSIERAIRTRGYVSIQEPAAGSGAMILAMAAEMRALGFDPTTQLFVSAWENEEHAAEACFLQLALAGIPAIVTHGNTLTLEQFGHWNTPALFAMRRRHAGFAVRAAMAA